MKNILLIIPFLILSSCFDVVSWNYWEEGNYYITDNPGTASCKSLYIEVGGGGGHGRIDYVDAIGSNDKYIIVKSTLPQLEYWILNKEKDDPLLNSNEIVEGPFTQSEFNSRKKALNIEKLKFTNKW